MTQVTWKRIGEWDGGYVRQRADGSGKPVYVIEKWIGGRRFHVSTRCNTEWQAKQHWRRFQVSPVDYHPAGKPPELARVVITSELTDKYFEHQLAAGVTREWADEVERCLGDWCEALGGRDLRGLSLHADIKPALARKEWKRKPHRIKALKGFCRWLREEQGLLTRTDDPTLDLRVPQATPEKWKRRKVVPAELVQLVLAKLEQPARDVLHLLTATAWHLSEVYRFAKDGEVVRVPRHKDAPLAVLITKHKSGELTRTPVLYEEHLEAAVRLQERKTLPKRMLLSRQLHAAFDLVDATLDKPVQRFGFGVMRHSVLTWGVELGASAQAAADFAHHKSKATTERFYLDVAVPKAAIPILRLG